MIQINIKKLDGSIGWSAQCLDQESVNIWINEQLALKSWGQPDRWLRLMEGDSLIELAEDSREVDLGSETAMEYFFSAEYNIEQIDLGNDPLMESLRFMRNMKLSASDWTQLADAPLDSDQKAAWAVYRQALRDLPEQEGLDPANPAWPIEPI